MTLLQSTLINNIVKLLVRDMAGGLDASEDFPNISSEPMSVTLLMTLINIIHVGGGSNSGGDSLVSQQRLI